jgi:restriction system protein
MPRRRESTLDLLIALPWYAVAAIGVGLYMGGSSIAVFLGSFSPILKQLVPAIAQFARILSYVCVATAALSALRSYFVRRKFGAQRTLADLRALTWQQFESIVGEAFRRQGYSVLETGQGGADGGVDLVLKKAGQRYLVQCKQYRASTVSVMTVREIFGVVAARGATGAIVVTTGKFTKDAFGFARGQPIQLIDGTALEQMVREINVPSTHGIQAPDSVLQEVDQRRSPSATQVASVIPSCPRCGCEMVLRKPRIGGDTFYGCSTFPKCRGTRTVS